MRSLSGKDIEKIAKAVWELFSKFRVLQMIPSDSRTEFVNYPITKRVNLNDIEQHRISLYNNRNNGGKHLMDLASTTLILSEPAKPGDLPCTR